jgi:hypothetical protein
MFYYTEKLWAWLAVQSLRSKFYSMMAMSAVFVFLHGIVHVINRAGLWLETKLLNASSFFFNKG